MLYGFWRRLKRAVLNIHSAFLSDTSFSISGFYIDLILLDLVATRNVLLLCIMQKFVTCEGKYFGKLILFFHLLPRYHVSILCLTSFGLLIARYRQSVS